MNATRLLGEPHQGALRTALGRVVTAFNRAKAALLQP